MTRRIYPRPPITEAVVDFRFPTTVSGKELMEAVLGALGDDYAGAQRRQDAVEVEAKLNEDSVAAAARRKHHLTFLSSKNGLRLVGCGDGMLSVHALAPYPGWEVFSERVRAVVGAARDLLEPTGIHQVAVRYIDRMALPVSETVSFNDLLTAMPQKPDAMPDALTGFHFVTQTVDQTDGTFAALVLASVPSTPDGVPVVLYDLTVSRVGDPVATAQEEDWLPIVEALHTRQREIFEDSITDKLRETFQ